MNEGRFLTKTDFARMLRKRQTPEETIMWGILRNRKFLGFKFLRQYPIPVWQTNLRYHYYFTDFYCSEKRLVIEIDGLIHTGREDYDRSRDEQMTELKLRVLRIKNEEVNNDLISVLEKIKGYLLIP